MSTTKTLCVGFGILSIVWAVASGLGGADGLWTEYLGAPSSRIWPLTEGIWAGTTAGKWCMFAVAVDAMRRRSLALVLLGDIVVEGLMWWQAGLSQGAVFVLPSVLVLLVVLLGRHEPSPVSTRIGGARWLGLACAGVLLTGVGLVFDFDGLVFASYRHALEGLDGSPPWAWVECSYARIGIGYSVHYITLVVLLHQRGAAPIVLRGAVVAQLVWFATDSTTNLVHGAAFNVLMVNLPAMVLFGAGWWGTARAARADSIGHP